jgi:nucleoside-specific outer membrane channel protein Tsx
MNTHRVPPSARRVAFALIAALLAPAAQADGGFSTTNVQLLQGYSFKDNLLGYDTYGGTMTTVTINHFSTWEYGDNFLFGDAYRGNFKGGYGADLYGEWHPRLFLNKLAGLPAGGVVRNWGVAAELNQGRGFTALMAGPGFDLALPGFVVAGVNLYYRYDTVYIPGVVDIYTHTWQLSPFWTVPFSLGKAQFLFTGFLDLTTNHDKKLDLMTQPELLVDVGALLGQKAGKLHAGVEWYLHSYADPAANGDRKTVSAPQAMVQWTVY